VLTESKPHPEIWVIDQIPTSGPARAFIQAGPFSVDLTLVVKPAVSLWSNCKWVSCREIFLIRVTTERFQLIPFGRTISPLNFSPVTGFKM